MNSGISRRLLAVSLFLAALHTPALASDAAGYPSRLVKIIVAFGAGGPPDTVARVVAAGLEQKLGQSVVVENMAGASGALATRAAARATPDGYTLMVVDMSFIVARHVAANFGMEPLKLFKPVGLAARAPFTLIASSSVNAPTAGDFVKLAKGTPDDVIVGHTGIGTTPHLAFLSFANATGIKPRLVPYRTVGEAMTNSMSGLISGVFSAASTAIGASGSDKVKVLGVTGEKRLPQLPNVPTFAESGIRLEGFEQGAWYGVVAPIDTPDAIVAKLNGALKDIAADEALRQRLGKLGVEARSDTPAEFKTFLTEQDMFWDKTLKAAGIMPSAQ